MTWSTATHTLSLSTWYMLAAIPCGTASAIITVCCWGPKGLNAVSLFMMLLIILQEPSHSGVHTHFSQFIKICHSDFVTCAYLSDFNVNLAFTSNHNCAYKSTLQEIHNQYPQLSRHKETLIVKFSILKHTRHKNPNKHSKPRHYYTDEINPDEYLKEKQHAVGIII